MPEMDGFQVVERLQEYPKLVQSVVMLLTSDHVHVDAARCRELGVGSYLIKPVQQSELLSAITAIVYPKKELDVKASTQAAGPAAPLAALRVLLAEDNVINQKFAVRLLEKNGHEVMVAQTGKEVLEKLDQCSFDLVLMDVQMPEMDGLTATAAIRHQEQKTGNHIPIIAMTAHAMKGDRERCLAAGMDGYLSKPINSRELFQTIHTVLQGLEGFPVTVPSGDYGVLSITAPDNL